MYFVYVDPSSSLIPWYYLFSRPRMIDSCVNFVHPWNIASALLFSQFSRRLMQAKYPGTANLKATDATLVSAPTSTGRRATGTVCIQRTSYVSFFLCHFRHTAIFLLPIEPVLRFACKQLTHKHNLYCRCDGKLEAGKMSGGARRRTSRKLVRRRRFDELILPDRIPRTHRASYHSTAGPSTQPPQRKLEAKHRPSRPVDWRLGASTLG